MSIKTVFSLIFLSVFFQSNAQNSIVNDSIDIPKGSFITTDNLENLFVITPTNDIIKYDKEGNKLATANFKVLGNISSVDASNPFEIYVFYRDQNRIIFLDNLLNLRGECDMESIGVSQIACVARSFDNQIWLFDAADQKLKKYSKDLKLISESAPWNTLSIQNSINPVQIKDISNGVLILNNNQVLEFDIFANFSRIKLSDTLQNFQFVGNKIVFFKNGNAYAYQPQSFTLKALDIILPEKCKGFRLEKERLYILEDEYVILQNFSEK